MKNRINRSPQLFKNNRDMNKIERMPKQKSDEEKMYEILTDSSYTITLWHKQEQGEGMSLIDQAIGEYWKPRFLMDNNTRCAYEFMNSSEHLVTVSANDINWESLAGICEEAVNVAKSRWFHYPSFIRKFKNGVAEVSWQLNPDGMYFMDDDGFGMTNDEEISLYGYIDKKGNVLVKFQIIKKDDELKVMRQAAEKIVKKN